MPGRRVTLPAGWGNTVPLAATKRLRARNRAGIKPLALFEAGEGPPPGRDHPGAVTKREKARRRAGINPRGGAPGA